MARCSRIKIKKRKVCIGDLRFKIGLYDRDLGPSAFGSFENTQNYTIVDTVSAAIQTINGIDIFDGVEKSGQDGVPVTAKVIVYIRFRSDVTAQNFFQYKGTNYEILRVDPLDLRSELLKLYCAPRGLVVNQAAL